MPTVHLLLAVNDILRPHMVEFFGSEENLMQVLKEKVWVVPHSYQGKDGAYEGPQCSKILNHLEDLAPYLTGMDGLLFLNILKSFNAVKKAVEGLQNLNIAHTCVSLPITPKLHIMWLNL